VIGYASGLRSTQQRSASEALFFDPADLAAGVRQLALDIHRVMKDPNATFSELGEVSRRIEALRQQTRVSALSEIDRWLQNTGKLVQTRGCLPRDRTLEWTAG
jgi:hypothetical protein